MNILSRTLVLGLVLAMGTGVNAQVTDIIGDSTTSKGPNFVGSNSALGNGDFEISNGSGTQPFNAVANWHNIAGNDLPPPDGPNFGADNGTVGSPQSGSLGAFLSIGSIAANDTGYTIGGADETFNLNMYLGQFGNQNNYGGDEAVTATLFTSTTGVTDSTVVGDITVLNSISVNPFILVPDAAFFNMAGGELYTSVAADTGKEVFLSLALDNATGSAIFPRIDVVSLSVSSGSVAVPGDFTGDGIVDDADIDELSANLGLAAGAASDPTMELVVNGTIDLADHDAHITTQVQDANGTGALIGDLNLDGDVDVSQITIVNGQVINTGDASVLLASLGQTTGQLYSDGDLNGDGDVDVSQIVVGGGGVQNLGDASRLLANLGQTTGAAPAASAVPEPGSLAILAIAGMGVAIRRRK